MPATRRGDGHSTPAADRRRPLAASLLVGVVHAAVLLGVALHLGYEVGPAGYSVVGASWRYGGLVVVAALPVWLAVRHQLLAPLLALVATTGYVLGMELAPPGPTFRDVAELEGLAEPTGITVVENGLYVVKYMVNASVWGVGFLFLGLLEAAVRDAWTWLPTAARVPTAVIHPKSRRQVARVAAVAGLLHAAVMVWYAARVGVTMGSTPTWAMSAYGAVGTWLLAALPVYLLLGHRVVAPATLLTAAILFDVQAALGAAVEDPHALYVGAWFVLLALALVAGGLEVGCRRLALHERIL